MSIQFYRGRLLVGYRLTDWAPVWMELKAPNGRVGDEEGQNADREYNFELFRFRSGKGNREPDENEVAWLPHFDPAHYGGKTKPIKLKIQKRFLSDAWLYLSANDPKQVEELEQSLRWQGFTCWQRWLKMAKKFKHQRMRRSNRGNNDDGGFDDDSAYSSSSDEDDDDDDPPTMAPPRRRPNANKRRAPNGGAQNGAKRSRTGTQRPLNFQRKGEGFSMSGGLGSRSTVSRSMNEDEDDDLQSLDYDDTPPEDHNNNVIYGNNLDDLLSARGSRHRGNSRSESPYDRWETRSNQQHRPPGNTNHGIDYIRRFQEANGELDEDEAFEQARQASMSLPPGPQQDADEEALERARQASLRDHQAGDGQNEP